MYLVVIHMCDIHVLFLCDIIIQLVTEEDLKKSGLCYTKSFAKQENDILTVISLQSRTFNQICFTVGLCDNRDRVIIVLSRNYRDIGFSYRIIAIAHVRNARNLRP